MSLVRSSAYEKTEKLDSAAASAGADFILANQSGNDKKMTITQLNTFFSANVGSNDITMGEGKDFILGTTTGTQFGTASGQKVGFFGVTPVVKGAVLTTADAVALDATYNVTEQTTVSNMRIRINEIESRLTTLGLFN